VTVGGVAYASEYRITGGSGYTYTTGTALTIGSANVVDTAGAAAAANVSFTMTDIVAPNAAIPPSSIAVDNIVNSAEKMVNIVVEFSHQEARTGDILRVYRDGIEITSLSQLMVAGATSTSVSFGGSHWGADDGIVNITVRIEDSVGNIGMASVVKPLVVDTTMLSNVFVSLRTGTEINGRINDGAVIQLEFQENVNLTSAMLPPEIFGVSGLSVAAEGGLGGTLSRKWNVTLGSNSNLMLGESFEVGFGGESSNSLLLDFAGNRGSASGVVPLDLLDMPGEVFINNIASNNVLDEGERSIGQSIAVSLRAAKIGDIVRLYMDGSEVASLVVKQNGQTAANFLLGREFWGADGERVFDATISRGERVVGAEQARSVYVSSDAQHWAQAANVLWFDPDAMTNASTWRSSFNRGNPTALELVGSTVGQTIAAAGSQGATTSAQPQLIRSSVNGHSIVFLENAFYTSSNGWDLPALDNASVVYTFSAFIQARLNADWAYAISAGYKYAAADQSGARMQFGTKNVNAAANTAGGEVNSFINNAVALNSPVVLMNRLSFVDGVERQILQANFASVANTSGNKSTYLYPSPVVNDFMIGATRYNNGEITQALSAQYGDQIYAKGLLSFNQMMEVNVYLLKKYGGMGSVTSYREDRNYDLAIQQTNGVLIDDILEVGDRVGNDIVVTAGADFVNTRAGNDKVYIKDLAFRHIDGGLGFDIFALHSQFTGGVFNLTDYVSNARGISGGLSGSGNADDIRVNANGYHKLLGFEQLDFSISEAKQTITIAAADADQLAEKNLAGDPNKGVNTSNLYALLGSNDRLVATGFSTQTRGFWKDINGLTYDRRFSQTGGTVIGQSDTANLFVRGGDDAPEFGTTQASGSYSVAGSTTTLSFAFNEAMAQRSLTASDFSITHSGGTTVPATSAALTSTGMGMGLSVTVNGQLSGVLRLQYGGTQLVDLQGDQLRFKDISLGTSAANNINGSTRSSAQALMGGAGGDVISGGSGEDLLIGGLGNDNLTGGAGADIFRFIQFESGQDTINDFNLNQGDKIDLRGVLSQTGFTLDTLNLFVQLEPGFNQSVLKVDALGTGNFNNPGLTVTLLNPQGINDDLLTLIDQRVFLVL
jgi:hypothetical protein